MTRPKRTKAAAPPPAPVAEISGDDRAALIAAYKSGLIVGWRREGERGYRLTFGDHRDEYVEVAKLTSYLAKARKGSS